MRGVKFYLAPEKDSCFFNVVGESFRMDDIRRLVKVGRKSITETSDGWKKLGVVFWLVPEPTNRHDPNAVAVCATSKGAWKVGYIPAAKATRWVGKIHKPVSVRGVVVGKRKRWGVKLDTDALKAAGLR